MNNFSDFLSEAAAGMAQVGVGYPLDTLKVHLVQHGMSSKKSYRKLTAKELFRGILSPMVGGIGINVLQFNTYHAMRRLNQNTLVSGAVAGAAVSIIESPVELIKCRMQTGTETYLDCIKRISRDNPNNYALKNLYRGFWATTLRNVPAVGIYYWSYDLIKNWAIQKTDNKYLSVFLGGAVAGVACWAPNYPVDNWKTQIQVDRHARSTTLIEVAKKTGWQNSWRGFLPCIARAGVVNPFVFLAYELVLDYMN